MKAYIVSYEDDLVVVTNNVDKWLEENNKQRLNDGEEIEGIGIFSIKETELYLF